VGGRIVGKAISRSNGRGTSAHAIAVQERDSAGDGGRIGSVLRMTLDDVPHASFGAEASHGN
jgi:hypothetical protein